MKMRERQTYIYFIVDPEGMKVFDLITKKRRNKY